MSWGGIHISGSVSLMKKVCAQLSDTEKVIVWFEVNFKNHKQQASSLASDHKIVWYAWTFPTDTDYIQFGGGTDARFLFGFGSSLGVTWLPEAQHYVQRSLTHYLDGGTEGHFSSIGKNEVDPILNPLQSVILQDGLMRIEGVFSMQWPRLRITCPSYF